MGNTYICDIDGTIANGDHRVHLAREKQWDLYFEHCDKDEPVWQMQHLLKDLAGTCNGGDLHMQETRVVYFSGRPERVREKTLAWLRKHRFPDGDLYMRRDGDHRPDYVAKREMYENYLADMNNDQPIMVFDDRDQVVRMWRDMGLICAQVNYGDF